MNPYVIPARRRHADLKAEVQAIVGGAESGARDLSSDELRRVTAAAAEAEQLARAIESFERDDARADAVAAAAPGVHSRGEGQADVDDYSRGARPLGAGNPYGGSVVEPLGYGGGAGLPMPTEASAVPPLMPTERQAAEIVEHLRSSSQVPRRWIAGERTEHERAAVTTSITGYPARQATMTLREPRRIATAARLDVLPVAGFEAITWATFAGAATADIVPEGLPKPEWSGVGSDTARAVVISEWTEFSNQVALTVPTFVAQLRAKHSAHIAKKENTLALAQIVAKSPTLVTGTTGQAWADTLLVAAAGVLDAAEVPADLIICHPSDVARILPSASHGSDGESPAREMRLSLHGATIFPTSAQASGTALVGAFSAGMTYLLAQPLTVMVDPYTGMTSNKTKLLTEIGCNFAVDDPTCFRRVTFAA